MVDGINSGNNGNRVNDNLIGKGKLSEEEHPDYNAQQTAYENAQHKTALYD